MLTHNEIGEHLNELEMKMDVSSSVIVDMRKLVWKLVYEREESIGKLKIQIREMEDEKYKSRSF